MNNSLAGQARWKIPFFTIWTGGAFSLFGSSVAQFALVWWLTDTTGSATVLATASLVALLPGVLLGPIAGAIVDRWDRRVIMIISDGIGALAAAALAYLFWIDMIAVWHVYVVMLVRSLAGTFHFPAMEASTSLMVPQQQLARVAGLNQLLQGAMAVAAPPAGALLLSLIPLPAVMGVDVVTAGIAIGSLLLVRIPRQKRSDTPATGHVVGALLSDVRAALRYVWNWPGMVALLGMATVINFLLNPAFALMPILVTRHFGGDALQLGWMNSAMGIGMILGGLLLSAWGGFRRRIITTLVGVIGMGAGILGVGLAPAHGFWLAFVALFLASIMMALTNGPLFALVQALVAPEMQGRVFTLVGSLAAAMSPLGLMVAGPVADTLGVRAWFIIGGGACLLMGVAGFFMPTLLQIEDRPAGDKGDDSQASIAPTQGVARAAE